MTYNNRGSAYVKIKNYQLALEDFKKAIKFDPNNALGILYRIKLKWHKLAHSNLGDIYNRLGRYKKAIDCCNQSIKLDSKCSNAYNNRGTSWTYLLDYKNAIKDFTSGSIFNKILLFIFIQNNQRDKYKNKTRIINNK